MFAIKKPLVTNTKNVSTLHHKTQNITSVFCFFLGFFLLTRHGTECLHINTDDNQNDVIVGRDQYDPWGSIQLDWP